MNLIYTWGFFSQRCSFELFHYINFLSAVRMLRPSKVTFYYRVTPSGQWWEKIDASKESLNLPNRKFPYSPEQEMVEVDRVKLDLLLAKGGVLLDTDLIVTRPPPKVWSDMDAVVSSELNSNGVTHVTNSFLMAKPGSDLIKDWKEKAAESKTHFEISRGIPTKLLLDRKYKRTTVLPDSTFQHPVQSNMGIVELLGQNEGIHPTARGHHVRETRVRSLIQGIKSREDVEEGKGLWHLHAKQYASQL